MELGLEPALEEAVLRFTQFETVTMELAVVILVVLIDELKIECTEAAVVPSQVSRAQSLHITLSERETAKSSSCQTGLFK